ncbi:putative ribonuclease H-like domain-containing protein [Tanacetum coccineum]
MTTLQFADTHNLVAFLTKSAESEGFEQIVDFLNASSIKYALTVNPTIYTQLVLLREMRSLLLRPQQGNPQQALKYKGMFDIGCSRNMTGNKALLTDYQDIDGGFVAFGGSTRGGKITGIGKIRTNKIDFEDVFFAKELKFNIFSVSQMCDKKNSVLFPETECLVLSIEFKLIDESQVLLRVPRQNNMLGHVNFKTMNKLVKGNLVRGLPSKTFENDHTCVAFQKGKQHKVSCKTKLVSSISQPLQMLYMDLFGPTSVRSINHKTYCLVVTDDFSRFSLVFFLATKSETSGILKQKGIKREYSFARTPQQNGVVERKNRTLIEAARTMLVDSLLPIVFWAKTINTACYVLNRVLVTKPYNKTPYEIIIGRAPSISFMRPVGCPVTILNTLDPLGKFDGKAKERFLVGYFVKSKAFRVFNTESRKVEENLHVNFLENKPNVVGQGPNWIFDIDSLTNSMNYQSVTAGNQTNKNVGPQETNGNQSSDDKAKDYTVDDDACKKTIQELASEYDQALKNVLDKMMDQEKEATEQSDVVRKEFEAQCDSQEKITRASSTNNFNTVSTPVNTASASRTFSPVGPSFDTVEIQSTGIFGNAYDDPGLESLNTPYADQSVGTEADFNNMESSTVVSLIPTTRVHSIHPKAQIIGDPKRKNHKDFQNCLFACFLSQHEPTKISQALDVESWVKAMQEELLQFKIQKVWTLVDLPSGKKAIGTKWVYRNKKDERGIVMDVKSTFLYGTIEDEVYVCQPVGFVDLEFPKKVYKVEKALYGLHQAPRAWYETLSTNLLENEFHMRQINKTLFIKRLKGDILLVQVYVDDIIFGSTKKSLFDEFKQIMHNRFQMSSMGELTFFMGLQVKQKEDGIFISQDKYVGEIWKKFGFSSLRTASTLMETNKALTNDEDGEDVDVHLYMLASKY